ncbi:MAG: SPASM domain-containing protein, partial [Nitrospirota bacterium]
RYVSGNVSQESIMELWNNERTRDFRRAIQNRDYTSIEKNGPMCSQCTLLWNSHYNIKSNMKEALGQVVNYTFSGLKEYFGTHRRRQRLYKKYQFLREFREQFVDQLSSHTGKDPEFSQAYQKVLNDGVLDVRL